MSKDKLALTSQILEYGHKVTNEHLFWCPKCKHHKPKLSLNFSKNVFKCWVCGLQGDNIYYLFKRYGNFFQQQEWLGLTGTGDIETFKLIFEGQEKEETIVTKVELPNEYLNLSTYKYLKHFWLKPAYEYLTEKRGLSHSEIVRWRLGCCVDGNYKGRIIFPSFDEKGEVNYFVARAYGKEWPPYKNPELSKDIVFNELEVDWDHEIILVEGAFDSIKQDSSIPLLGSTLTEKNKIFKKILEHNTTVYLALDQDALKKAIRIIEMFLSYGVKVNIIDTRGYEDVGVMTNKEFQKRKKEAEEVNYDNIIMLRSLL